MCRGCQEPWARGVGRVPCGLDFTCGNVQRAVSLICLGWKQAGPVHPVMCGSQSSGQRSWCCLTPQGSRFSSVQSLSHVRLFATPWTAAHQASLSITNSRSSLKLTSIESVMPSNHLTFCRPLLLPPSIFPSIRVFSNESVLHTRWPKY